jgi:hypothetical protein
LLLLLDGLSVSAKKEEPEELLPSFSEELDEVVFLIVDARPG